MRPQAALFAPLLASAVLCLWLATVAWRRRPAPGANVFCLMMVAVSLWSVGYALELSSPDLAGIVLWSKVEYISIVSCPVLGLLLALAYVGRNEWVGTWRTAALAAVPATTLALFWTNDMHGLVWSAARAVPGGAGVLIEVDHGPWFLVHAGYSYALVLAGLAVVVGALFRATRPYRGQAAVLALATATPLLGNALYLVVPERLGGIDLTPFAFALAGGLWVLGLFSYRLLDIVPVAHEQVIGSMQDAVVVLDRVGRVVSMNPAALRILGRGREDVAGRPAEQLFELPPDMRQHLYGAGDLRDEIMLGDADPRHYDLRIGPLSDRHGRRTGSLMVLHDITELKRAEGELRAARVEAEAASRAKSAFLANMSHELRTPLTSILGYTDLVTIRARAAADAETVEDLDRVRSAGKHLLTLINDILDLSKIEAGRMELSPTVFDVSAVVARAAATVRPLADRAGNRLEVRREEPLGQMYGDATKLEQVLLNLLSNAARFTERGLITLTVWREHAGGEDTLVFQVGDTGIGMSAEQLSQLFREFTQLGNAPGRGGTGLGLALSERICRMMGGTIAVESEPGAGSTFTVRVPAAQPGAAELVREVGEVLG